VSTDTFLPELNVQSSHVDIYNSSSNSWSSIATGLGQARGYLAATSLPSGVVFFAGGYVTGSVKFQVHVYDVFVVGAALSWPSFQIDLYTTVFTCDILLMVFCTAVGVYSSRVDVYHVTSNSWSSHPEGLGQARSDMACASLPPDLVIFAGGEISGASKRVVLFIVAFTIVFGFCSNDMCGCSLYTVIRRDEC
jgi:hypothetical protein